jgi:hypothetical protein
MSFLDRLTRDEVQRYYERYIGPHFTPDGQPSISRGNGSARSRPNSASPQ